MDSIKLKEISAFLITNFQLFGVLKVIFLIFKFYISFYYDVHDTDSILNISDEERRTLEDKRKELTDKHEEYEVLRDGLEDNCKITDEDVSNNEAEAERLNNSLRSIEQEIEDSLKSGLKVEDLHRLEELKKDVIKAIEVYEKDDTRKVAIFNHAEVGKTQLSDKMSEIQKELTIIEERLEEETRNSEE
jgi:chromosome segregation ATPase